MRVIIVRMFSRDCFRELEGTVVIILAHCAGNLSPRTKSMARHLGDEIGPPVPLPQFAQLGYYLLIEVLRFSRGSAVVGLIKVIRNPLFCLVENATSFLNLILSYKKPHGHGKWGTAVKVGSFVRQAAKNLAIEKQRLCHRGFRCIRIRPQSDHAPKSNEEKPPDPASFSKGETNFGEPPKSARESRALPNQSAARCRS